LIYLIIRGRGTHCGDFSRSLYILPSFSKNIYPGFPFFCSPVLAQFKEQENVPGDPPVKLPKWPNKNNKIIFQTEKSYLVLLHRGEKVFLVSTLSPEYRYGFFPSRKFHPRMYFFLALMITCRELN
jgi:hypothetical protein